MNISYVVRSLLFHSLDRYVCEIKALTLFNTVSNTS
jgi:hypothetical protein